MLGSARRTKRLPGFKKLTSSTPLTWNRSITTLLLTVSAPTRASPRSSTALSCSESARFPVRPLRRRRPKSRLDKSRSHLSLQPDHLRSCNQDRDGCSGRDLVTLLGRTVRHTGYLGRIFPDLLWRPFRCAAIARKQATLQRKTAQQSKALSETAITAYCAKSCRICTWP